MVFASTPQTQQTTTTPSPAVPRKSDFPTTGLPLSNGPIGLGGSASPVPIVPPGPGPAPPAPSPAPAALPPPNLPPPYPNTMQVITYSHCTKNVIRPKIGRNFKCFVLLWPKKI